MELHHQIHDIKQHYTIILQGQIKIGTKPQYTRDTTKKQKIVQTYFGVFDIC